jgi:hypothetical protein
MIGDGSLSHCVTELDLALLLRSPRLESDVGLTIYRGEVGGKPVNGIG